MARHCVVAASLEPPVHAEHAMCPRTPRYVGCYTQKLFHVDGKGTGVAAFQIKEEDESSGTLTPLGVFDAGHNPSYLIANKAGTRLCVKLAKTLPAESLFERSLADCFVRPFEERATQPIGDPPLLQGCLFWLSADVCTADDVIPFVHEGMQ